MSICQKFSKVVEVKDIEFFWLLRRCLVGIICWLVVGARLVAVCKVMSGAGELLCLEIISIVSYVSARFIIHGKWVFGFLDFYLLLEVRMKLHLKSIWRRSDMRWRSVIGWWTHWHILRRSYRKLLRLSHWILLGHSHLELLWWPYWCLLVWHHRNWHALSLYWKIWFILS